MRLFILVGIAATQISAQVTISLEVQELPMSDQIDCAAIAEGYNLARFQRDCQGAKILAANVSAWKRRFGELEWSNQLNGLLAGVEEFRDLRIYVRNSTLRTININLTNLKRVICSGKPNLGVISIIGNIQLRKIYVGRKLGKLPFTNCSAPIYVKDNPALDEKTIRELKSQFPQSQIQNYLGAAEEYNKNSQSESIELHTTSTIQSTVIIPNSTTSKGYESPETSGATGTTTVGPRTSDARSEFLDDELTSARAVSTTVKSTYLATSSETTSTKSGSTKDGLLASTMELVADGANENDELYGDHNHADTEGTVFVSMYDVHEFEEVSSGIGRDPSALLVSVLFTSLLFM